MNVARPATMLTCRACSNFTVNGDFSSARSRAALRLSIHSVFGLVSDRSICRVLFFPRPSVLRGVQMQGALLWITYGVLIKASPVIVANMLVYRCSLDDVSGVARGGESRKEYVVRYLSHVSHWGFEVR